MRRLLLFAAVMSMLAVVVPMGGQAQASPAARPTTPACSIGTFDAGFADVPVGNLHGAAIDCIVYWQVTTGLRAGVYHPTGTVTREQMASFLARFIERSGGTLPANPPPSFPDADGSAHRDNIDKLAEVGIASGRPDGTFAPRAPVTRAQMASFIVRTLEYRLDEPITAGIGADHFDDDDGDDHEDNIDKAAELGIAGGTTPTTYAPRQLVRRDQMASFLARSLAELVDRGLVQVPAAPPRCSYDDGIERTDSRCRPCPVNPGVGITHPSCRTWTGTPPLGRPAAHQRPNTPQVWDVSDPSVLIDGQATYLFGSTNNVRVPVRHITSFDEPFEQSRLDWARRPQDAMPQRPAWVNPSNSDIWAPSVAKIGDRYVMYFAARRAGATDGHNDQCIGRANAASATGPYAPEPQPAYCGLPAERGSNPWGRGALDPEVFRAPTGELFLLVALSRTEDNIGVLRLSAAGAVAGGPNAIPTILQRQAYPWHDGTDDATRIGGFLENPSMVFDHHTATYLLFYSAGTWHTDRYLTGFARCSSPTGPCAAQTVPFLVGGNSRSGPGGLSAFTAPDGTLRAVYATWQAGQEPPHHNPDGRLSRHSHWARIELSPGQDPNQQTVALG